MWWTRDSRASVILRRDNLVIAYSKSDASAALALARRIDQLVRTDRQIAPRGVADEFPEITALGIPDSLTTPCGRTRTATQPSDAPSRSRIQIAPSFFGLGDAADLRIRIVEDGKHDTLNETTQDGRSQDRIVVMNADGRRTSRPRRADEDGRFQFNVPLPAGPTVLRMIVATPSNMIVTRTTAVTISESP